MTDNRTILADNDPRVLKAIQDARHKLWRLGNLSYLWHETQQQLDAKIAKTKGKQYFVLCSRRWGKSQYLLSRAFGRCLRQPNARVLYLAPTGKNAAEIVADIAVKLLPDCPDDVKPEWKQQSHEYHFKNGSILRLKGVNGEHVDVLRGTEAHEIYLDEAAKMDNLKKIVKSVCLPMIFSTRGQIIFGTTPAESPGHESFEIYSELAMKGATTIYTIRDAPQYTDEEKANILIEQGEAEEDAMGMIHGTKEAKTTDVQREFFCEWVSSSESRVVPEWTKAAAAEIVRPYEYDGICDAYTILDPGFVDGAGILYVVNDFTSGKLAFVGESLLYKASTSDLAEALLDREYTLFKGQKPFIRYSDVDNRLRADFQQRHGITISPVQKQNSQGAINLLRTMVRNREIIIDPSCEKLIKQLEFGIWNKKATDFSRDEDGHLDLLACMKYACRMINRRRMPDGHVPSSRPTDPDRRRSYYAQQHDKDRNLGLLPKNAWGRKLAKRRRS